MLALLPHQTSVLDVTKDRDRVAYFLDMGLGKTYVGAEKMMNLGNPVNLVICQKSKIHDWVEHFKEHYDTKVLDLRKKDNVKTFMGSVGVVGIINYELVWRRPILKQLRDFTLMLDESSLIQNVNTKSTRFVISLKPKGVILLSGTPTSGKYENLWTQAHLLGWNISQERYDATYVNWTLTPDDGSGFRHRIVDKNDPYKNVDRLKNKLREYGSVFMKTEEVIDLPEQTFIPVMVDAPKEYNKFVKNGYICIDVPSIDDINHKIELIGDTLLTKRLYARQLASQYNQNKIDAVSDLIQSTNDRLIVFYNFNDELATLKRICNVQNRPYSEVNGSVKDLSMYETEADSVTLVQFQAGAMGLNLQKCNKIIYFSLPERSELFEQSKKRIHRIGQSEPCFYYLLMARNTIDEQIYEALKQKKDLTDYLFEEGV